MTDPISSVPCPGCAACDIYDLTTPCNMPLQIDVLDASECPESYISIETKPCFGTATVSGQRINYTPCREFIGVDSFTYKVDDDTVGTVKITVGSVNESCRYYPILYCNGAPLDPPLFIHKSHVCCRKAERDEAGEKKPLVFRQTDPDDPESPNPDTCYRVGECATCNIPEGGTEVTSIYWIDGGCCDRQDCLPPPMCGCGGYCFSADSEIELTWSISLPPGILSEYCRPWYDFTGRAVAKYESCGVWKMRCDDPGSKIHRHVLAFFGYTDVGLELNFRLNCSTSLWEFDLTYRALELLGSKCGHLHSFCMFRSTPFAWPCSAEQKVIEGNCEFIEGFVACCSVNPDGVNYPVANCTMRLLKNSACNCPGVGCMPTPVGNENVPCNQNCDDTTRFGPCCNPELP